MTQIVLTEETGFSEFKTYLNTNNINRILLFTGKGSYASSGAERFMGSLLDKFNGRIKRICEFESNPNIIDLKNILTDAKQYSPDIVIAIGGGSVLDMAKLVRFYLSCNKLELNNCESNAETLIPLVAIPTTSGTGSETTHFAVLYDENKIKHSITHPHILPEWVILDSGLTNEMSPYLTACTGFDALAQAIESYWNVNATSESESYALKAVKLIWPNIKGAVSNPTQNIRHKMLKGAFLAGKAINITKTTAPHAFSYPFTSHYGYPHGHAVALVFPHILGFNLKYGGIPEGKLRKLSEALNVNPDMMENSFRRLTQEMGLVLHKADYDISLLMQGVNTDRLSNNPATFNNTDVYNIYKSVCDSLE